MNKLDEQINSPIKEDDTIMKTSKNVEDQVKPYEEEEYIKNQNFEHHFENLNFQNKRLKFEEDYFENPNKLMKETVKLNQDHRRIVC